MCIADPIRSADPGPDDRILHGFITVSVKKELEKPFLGATANEKNINRVISFPVLIHDFR